MNNTGINLLPPKKITNLKEAQVTRIVRSFSILLLFVVSAISIVVFSIKLQSPLLPIQKEERKLLSDLSLLQVRLVKYYTITNRLETISDVLVKRTIIPDALDFTTAIIPPSVSVKSFRLDKTGLSMSLDSISLVALNSVMDKLIIGIDRRIFKQVTMDSLAYDSGRKAYILSVRATLQ